MDRLTMTEIAMSDSEALIRGLINCASQKNKYEGLKSQIKIKWLEPSAHPKLLISDVKIHTLVRIARIVDCEDKDNDHKTIDRRILERVRKALNIMSNKMIILDDLRFNPQSEKTWKFILNLWHKDDIDLNINLFKKEWKKSKSNVGVDDIFHSITLTQALLDAIPLPIFYKDSNFIYRGCNKKFEDFLGRPKEEILGMPVSGVSLPKEYQIYKEMDEQLIQGYPENNEQIYVAPVLNFESEKRTVRFYKGCFPDSQGTSAGGLVGVILDLTNEQKSQIET